MSAYVSDPAQSVFADPDANERIKLVIGVAEEHLPDVREWVTANGGEILREAPFELLLIEVPEPVGAELPDREGVESVETDDTIEVLGSGNL